jgi:hypothetical protein
MNPIKYNFPNLRVGIICETPIVSDPGVEDIVEKIRNDKERHESIIEQSIKSKFNPINKKECSDLNVVEYEGPAIHSPTFKFIVTHDGTKYDILLGSTIVICMMPFKSKIWTRISLTAINEEPAIDLSFEDNQKFFDIFQYLLDDFSTSLYRYFHDTLAECDNQACHRYYTIDIKAISSNDACIKAMMKPITEEKPFSIVNAFKEEDSRHGISDYLQFSFYKKIENEHDYRDHIQTFRKSQKEKFEHYSQSYKILNNTNDITSNGYQWFGFIYRNLPSLVLRTESFQEPRSSYYCEALDTAECINEVAQSEDPKSAARVATGGIIRNLTRTI